MDVMSSHTPDLVAMCKHLSGSPVTPSANEKVIEEAAVAVIFAPLSPDNYGILLIKRAKREDDPWSGHVALPGGRRETQDKGLLETIIRETSEEVGITLDPTTLIGWRPCLQAQSQGLLTGIWVHPAVFVMNHAPAAGTSCEVQSAKWIPLVSFLDPANACIHNVEYANGQFCLPAIRLGPYQLWGLTYAILNEVFGTMRLVFCKG